MVFSFEFPVFSEAPARRGVSTILGLDISRGFASPE